MKGYTKKQLESTRPAIYADEAIGFCLKQLYADKKHSLSDEISDCLSYEELIGALLQASDELNIGEVLWLR